MSAEAVVRGQYPDLDPEAGPGAARRWRRLVRLAEVTQEYREAQERGEKAPATVVAEKRGVAPGTVRTWLHSAKREGFDVPPRRRIATVGDIVRHNVKTLRQQRRMTYVELARRLGDLGRPIPVLGLRRLEEGDRRVDVDDLTTLAQVFSLEPASLLELLPACRVCHGAPPPGFACTECGTTTKETT